MGGNRFWDVGFLDLTVSSGKAERQDGWGTLAVTSISFPDPLDQQPQKDLKEVPVLVDS